MGKFKSGCDPTGCLYPNLILSTEWGFYISYNARDARLYGDVTTAIVDEGNGYKFYILLGDHRDKLEELSKLGLKACLDYYKEQKSLQHKWSDKLL